ncbi:MAG: PKD domain-containing protein [Bacteroidales bacterium]
MNPAPIFVTQPTSSTVCLGGNPTQLEVSYTNSTATPTYQWYSNTINNTSSGSLIGGATTSTYSPSASIAGIVYYYCILTFPSGGCANITSNTAMVDVKADPAISIQPTASQSICVGGILPTALTVSYSAGTGTPTYQWYSNNTSSTTGGTIIPSAINASYIPPTFNSTGNYYYYLTINLSGSGCDATTSNIAMVTIVADPVIDTQAVVTQSLCQNAVPDNLHISVIGGVGSVLYQWYSNTINNNTGGSLISGATAASYTPLTTMIGTKYYYCVVTQTAAGCSVVSAVSAVVINSAPIIVTQPSSSSVCVGGIPTQLTVNYTNGNGSPAYQWYSNTINNTTSGSSIGGATTSTFNPPATTAGVTYYYCILTFSTGGCANITSNTAIVDVKADPAINIQPTVSQSICVGGVLPTSLSVNYTAGTGTPTYQWYSNTTSTTSGGTIIAAAINASYIPPTFITIGNYYYYLTINLSGSGCDATTSNIALVSVVADPVIDTQALVTQSLCQNAVPANLHISVSGGAGTIFYQWYSNTINSNSGGSLISGSTSATYAPSTTTVGTKYYYCIVTQSVAACMVVSAVSTLVVNSAPLFTLQPYSSDTCQGFIFAPISVNYSNGTGLPSYQWYSNLLNTTLGATPIAAATTNTFTPPSNTTGTVYYYCVISFSSGGCSNITSNVVAKIVYPKPIAAYAYTPVSGGQPLNVSFTNLSTTQPLSNLWTFGNGFPNLTNQNPVVLLTNTGVIDSLYSIRLIVTSTSGCKDTVVHTVNVHPLPITKFGAPNVCFGLATQFSDSSLNTIGIINNWHWNFGDGDTSNLQNPAHYYLNAGTYSVSLTTTNNLNISNTFTKNIIVYPLPVPNFTTTYDTLGCVSPATVSFTNTSTGAQTYKWNFGDNSTATTFNTSHIYVTTGYYFVKLFDTTQFKCVDSIQHRIRVISSPVANSHLSVSDSCGPLSVTFTNQSTGLYLSYLWNFNIGTPSTSVLPGPFTKVYPAGANDSIFYVSLKATNICGFKFYYDTITVFSKPKCDFGMTQNWGCSPLTISFLDTIVGHPDSLLWNFGDGSPKIHSSVFSQNIFHTFTYSGADDTTYNIKLIAYNKCGSDTIIKSLIVYRNTANAFFNTDTLFGCKPLTVHFTNCSQGATHYKWSFGDGNFSNQPTIAHTYSQPGVYIAYLAVDNDCSKDTFWSNPITVYPSPIVGFIYSGNHCTYDSVSFTSVTPGLSQYSWNFGDGGQSNLYNPKHKFNNYGNFAVKLIGYTINGCRDTSTQMINIQFTPTSKMNIIKRTDCSPLTTNIVNQTDNLNLNNYNWTIGNGNTYVSTQPPTQTFVNSSFCNDNFIPITLVSEYSGCYDTITDSVRVLPIPLSKFSLQDSCDFGFNSLVQTVNQSVCASAYTWKLNGSQVSVQTNPIIPIPNPGYFAIQQIASNLFQCKDTSEIVFHLFQSPFASIIMDTNNICEPFPATPINFSANIDSIQYLWSFGDGVIAIGQNVNHIYNQAGNYTVHVNISGMGGCLDSIQLTNIVHIHPRAKAKFSFLNNSMPYPDLWRVHFTNTSINSSIWNWTFGDGNSSTDENPSHSYPRKDSYLVTLAVNNSFNCPDDTAMWIQLNELWGLFIPSAFSPGNINPDIAYFKAYGDGLLEFNLEVYDTWGNKLWATSEILDKKPVGYWDGTVNGKPMPSDTYVWKVSARFIDGNPWFGMKQADGKYKTYGTITLIR